MSSVIILDSSDDESDAIDTSKSDKPKLPIPDSTEKIQKEAPPTTQDISIKENTLNAKVENQCLQPKNQTTNKAKRKLENKDIPPTQPVKRIKPILISKNLTHKQFEPDSPGPTLTLENDDEDPKLEKENKEISEENNNPKPLDTTEKEPLEENAITPTFNSLLEACRAADPSEDMETLIKKKLLKYYHMVHPDFVVSTGFSNTVEAVTQEIKMSPELVYYKLRTVVEELKIRRKSKSTVICNEEVVTTGNERKDQQIKRLNVALYLVKERIAELEETEVDLCDEENSTYLQVERFKKRACEIYEKICDLTGESKHAHRSVKKPIHFQGTCYPKFNRTIQAFVNRSNTFPDFFDVLRCLEHCNKQYGFGLKTDETKKIAQDAFLKIGKSLQSRRKTDLYETVSHFIGSEKDPALNDSNLNAKLAENKKYHAKIATIIDRFAAEQELSASVQKDKQNTSKEKESEPKTNVQETNNCSIQKTIVENNNTTTTIASDNDFGLDLLTTKNDECIIFSEIINFCDDNTAANQPVVSTVDEIIISDEEDS